MDFPILRTKTCHAAAVQGITTNVQRTAQSTITSSEVKMVVQCRAYVTSCDNINIVRSVMQPIKASPSWPRLENFLASFWRNLAVYVDKNNSFWPNSPNLKINPKTIFLASLACTFAVDLRAIRTWTQLCTACNEEQVFWFVSEAVKVAVLAHC